MSIFSRLFLIVFIEGYAVLATELIAIRELVSYVGNGTDIVSIIISAVLLPLAVGYYKGGHPSPKRGATGRRTARARLLRNFLTSEIILGVGLTLLFVDAFFGVLQNFGLYHRLILASLYAGLFLATPIYLLGQTIPLLSRFFRHTQTPKVAGKMLFWSTIGSFLGSILTTVVFMALFGVPFAATLVVGLLAAAQFILIKRIRPSAQLVTAALVFLVVALLNRDAVYQHFGIVYQNAYNTVMIRPEPMGGKQMMINNSTMSFLDTETGRRYPYIETVEHYFLDPITGLPPKREILVLGAGGFTFGYKEKFHAITYVDIDPDLKAASESHFLGKDLSPNKTFVATSARSFLRDAIHQGRHFDLVYIDTFNGELWPPESLVTQDFFADVQAVTKPDGFVLANLVISPVVADAYSRNITATFRSVFPDTVLIPQADFNGWAMNKPQYMNVLFIAHGQSPPPQPGNIYTDRRNRLFLDKSN